MLKKIIILLLITIAGVKAKAQTPDEVYDQYLDFNLKCLEGKADEAMKMGRRY
ncbi:hypothetical protein [Mucilaginibacter antarcticus]|uniref:hypothetical protein n=1 Tax=Mucilaginibacter antarcticus TaxID=1855725 RepID=UPI00362CB1B5